MAKASIVAARQADAMEAMNQRLIRIEAMLLKLLPPIAEETEIEPVAEPQVEPVTEEPAAEETVVEETEEAAEQEVEAPRGRRRHN